MMPRERREQEQQQQQQQLKAAASAGKQEGKAEDADAENWGDLARKPKTLNEIVERGVQADRLRHNTVAPEWTDRMLGKAKTAYAYMASHLDYSKLPSGDKLANNWGASVHGLVDPAYIDAMMQPPSPPSPSSPASSNSLHHSPASAAASPGNGLDAEASGFARIRPLPAPAALAGAPSQQQGEAHAGGESRLEKERQAQMHALEHTAGVA
mmetsp:Transcript_48355/g.98734  ORF Transcript_48355/g.98734 Transcript_48355/m.98734 type:complete len:211 (+) Transcript_48355:422-1054(+)